LQLQKKVKSKKIISEIKKMPCTSYDSEKNYCNYLSQKFYEGMQKPCMDVKEPKQCPIVFMREG
jgi:hypothetical protein